MQDRFKFRHFNKFTNKMVEPKNWQNVNEIYECLEQQVWVSFDENINPLPCVFMQCTGLKDKNGKLIYEGDIVKLGNGSINGSVMELIYEVEWNINGFNIPSWIINTHDFSHYIEVIGNIYENPELLEGGE